MPDIKSSLQKDLQDIEKFEEGFATTINTAIDEVTKVRATFENSTTSERRSVNAHVNRRTKYIRDLLGRTIRDLKKSLDNAEEVEEEEIVVVTDKKAGKK